MPATDILPGSYVLIRKEYIKPDKEKKHKLSPIAIGPFKVISVNKDTVVVEDGDKHERVSRDRIEPAPPPEILPAAPVVTPRTEESSRPASKHEGEAPEQPDKSTDQCSPEPNAHPQDIAESSEGLRDLLGKSLSRSTPRTVTRFNRNSEKEVPKGLSKPRKESGHTAAEVESSESAEESLPSSTRSVKDSILQPKDLVEQQRDDPSPESYQGPKTRSRSVTGSSPTKDNSKVSATTVPDSTEPKPSCLKANRNGRHIKTLRRVRFKEPEATSDGSESSDSGREVLDEEYVVDYVDDHGYNKKGKLLLYVKWYGYSTNENTWEPTRHIPRSQIVRYFRQKRLALPKDIDYALPG